MLCLNHPFKRKRIIDYAIPELANMSMALIVDSDYFLTEHNLMIVVLIMQV